MELKSKTPKLPKSVSSRTLLQVGVLVVAVFISFCAGVAYQQHKKVTNANVANADGSEFPNGRFSRRMSTNQVTAISSTSITVKDSRTDSSKTYTINSDTQITKDRQAASYSDIAVGDDVVVVASTSDATVASRIIDGFGGMIPQGGTTQSLDPNSVQTN